MAAAASSSAGPIPDPSETTGIFGGQRSIFGKGLGLAVLKGHADQPKAWTLPRRYELPDAMSWRNPVTDDLIKAWCSHGIPALVVFAAHFLALRYEEHEITHIIRLSAWLLSMMTPEEHKLGSKDILEKGLGFVKLWKNSDYVENNIGLFCTKEVHERIDDMWDLLNSQYVSKPFGSYYTAGQALKLLQDKAMVNGPKVFSTAPKVDTWLFKTRTDRFLTIMQDACYAAPRGPDGTIAAGDKQTIEQLIGWLDFESRCFGMALRYHNATLTDLNDMIIAQTILEDVTNYSNNKGKFRCAAQNHLMGMFTIARALERFVVGYQRMSMIGEVNALRVRINGIYQRFDIPDDLYKATGFNVISAEGGTSGSALHRFEDWGVPLLPNDGREPPDIAPDAEGKLILPFWSKDVYIPVPAQPKTGGDGEGSHSSMKVDPKPEPKVEAKKMPTPPSTPRGTTKSAPKKPTPPSEPPEWVNPVLPTGIDRKLEEGKDYKNLDFKAFLLQCGATPVASMSDGPHATNEATSGWRQYLWRFVFYSSTVFGITTEGIMKTTMLNASDEEWLKLYHYIYGQFKPPRVSVLRTC
eukprot:s1874_g11.t1